MLRSFLKSTSAQNTLLRQCVRAADCAAPSPPRGTLKPGAFRALHTVRYENTHASTNASGIVGFSAHWWRCSHQPAKRNEGQWPRWWFTASSSAAVGRRVARVGSCDTLITGDLRRRLAAALIPTTVLEQHPMSHHKDAELATDGIQFYVLPTWKRHPYHECLALGSGRAGSYRIQPLI